MPFLNRSIFPKIEEMMKQFPAVVILGVRQGGKTTLAKNLRPDWKYIDLEKPSDFDRVSLDPEFFLSQNQNNIIFDEIQRLPEFFEVLRGYIDQNRRKNNRFILTGSSSFELIKNVSESLAGRVGVIELPTLKVNEIFQTPLSAFYQFLNQKLNPKDLKGLMELPLLLKLSQIQKAFLQGGYPETVLLTKNSQKQLWIDNYVKTYLNRDLRALFPKLNMTKYRRFLRMLGELSGTIINKAEVARSIEVSEPTIKDYLAIADGSFVWRTLPSFESKVSKSIVRMPRGWFRDSGILNYFLKIQNWEDLENYPYLGRNFESFAIEEILKGVNAANITNWEAFFYRTRNGAEVDLVLEGPFGVLPIEIKYGRRVKKNALVSLSQFIKKHRSPFGIIVNHGSRVEMLSEEIIQIPLMAL